MLIMLIIKLVAAFLTFSILINAELYDATARNFTHDCHEYGMLGRDYCIVFMRCCSTDGMLNKWRGDRCKRADPRNGCTSMAGNRVVTFTQCKAFDCLPQLDPKSNAIYYYRSSIGL